MNINDMQLKPNKSDAEAELKRAIKAKAKEATRAIAEARKLKAILQSIE